MRSRHEAAHHDGTAFPIAGLILIASLIAGTPLSAQEDAASQAFRHPRIYADLLSPGTGLIYGAAHLRAGLESPLAGRASWAVEGEYYYSAPGEDSFVQADLLMLARFRPLDNPAKGGGWYVGAGTGLGWSSISSAATGTESFAGIATAETGWSIRRLFASPLYLEPFIRGYIVAPAASGNTAITAGTELGLRFGYTF